VFIYIHIFSD